MMACRGVCSWKVMRGGSSAIVDVPEVTPSAEPPRLRGKGRHCSIFI